jgi:hypothetical protein
MYEFARHHDPHHLHQLAASAHAFSLGLSWMNALFLICVLTLPALFLHSAVERARSRR